MSDTMHRIAYKSEIVDVKPGTREIVCAISTVGVDRDGDVVVPKGLVRKQFAGMTVFYNHDTEKPLGSTLWVKAEEDRVLAKWRATDRTPFAREMFDLCQDGTLNKYSVGFRALDASSPNPLELKTYGDCRQVIRKWEMFEFSLVGVPANDETTTLAVSKRLSAESRKVLSGEAPVQGVRPLTVGEVAMAMALRMAK